MSLRQGIVTQQSLETADEIDFAAAHGLDYVEVLMDGPDRREGLLERRADLEARLEDGGLDLLVHLPFPLDIGSPFEHVREGAVAEHEANLAAAADLGAEKAVLHPESSAWSGAWDDADVRPHVLESVRRLHAFGAERGIEVCPENLFDNVVTIAEMGAVFEETDAAMTLDTGHARIEGFGSADTAAFVAEHRDRISHVHLNDTRGASDEHLPLGAGNIDFAAILDPLEEATLSLEVASDSLDYLAASVEELGRIRSGR